MASSLSLFLSHTMAGVVGYSLTMAAARWDMMGRRGGCERCRAKALGVVQLVGGVRGLAVKLDGAIPMSEVAGDDGKVRGTVALQSAFMPARSSGCGGQGSSSVTAKAGRVLG